MSRSDASPASGASSRTRLLPLVRPLLGKLYRRTGKRPTA